MDKRKNWSYFKPGDLLMRLRAGEEDLAFYENPYIAQAFALGPQILTAAELMAEWKTLFSPSNHLIIEVGCYKGTTLTALAAHNPHCQFLGIDIKYKRVVLTQRKLAKAKLEQRARVAIIDLLDCLEIIPPQSLRGLCIFYPDPWTKARFLERRLFTTLVMDLIERALIVGGFLWIKTDHEEYHQLISNLVKDRPFFASQSPPPPLNPEFYPTDFERLFQEQKKQIHQLCLQRQSKEPDSSR